MPLLKPGHHFPSITITPVDGEAIDLPDALARHFGVVLFNRGSWCPYCNAQLRAFQRHAETLDGLGRQGRLPVGRRRGHRPKTGRQARPDVPRRPQRRRCRDRRGDRRVRQRRPGVPAVHRVRPRPGRQRGRQRLLKRRDRPPACLRTSPAWSTTSRPSSPHDHNHDDRRRARTRRRGRAASRWRRAAPRRSSARPRWPGHCTRGGSAPTPRPPGACFNGSVAARVLSGHGCSGCGRWSS